MRKVVGASQAWKFMGMVVEHLAFPFIATFDHIKKLVTQSGKDPLHFLQLSLGELKLCWFSHVWIWETKNSHASWDHKPVIELYTAGHGTQLVTRVAVVLGSFWRWKCEDFTTPESVRRVRKVHALAPWNPHTFQGKAEGPRLSLLHFLVRKQSIGGSLEGPVPHNGKDAGAGSDLLICSYRITCLCMSSATFLSLPVFLINSGDPNSNSSPTFFCFIAFLATLSSSSFPSTPNLCYYCDALHATSDFSKWGQ